MAAGCVPPGVESCQARGHRSFPLLFPTVQLRPPKMRLLEWGGGGRLPVLCDVSGKADHFHPRCRCGSEQAPDPRAAVTSAPGHRNTVKPEVCGWQEVFGLYINIVTCNFL